MFKGKKILLGVTGSIAAYKAAILTRLLIKQGAEVEIIMTADAKEFITPLTLSTLSKNPIHYEFVADEESGEWTNHIKLGLWADAFIIAPATANTIAKMANGICDNLLSATYLSARCPVYVAPAMDLDMWAHQSTQNNIKKLKSYGNFIIDVEDGELASGLEGKGRMAEPEHIIEFVADRIKKKTLKTNSFSGRTVLVTAGPTIEKLDPVRFLTNHSSGKMGISIANAFANLGAEVYLVKGPTRLKATHKVKTIDVESAEEMLEAVNEYFPAADITVMAAAVADYRPKTQSDKKIKKKGDDLTLELERTTDILKSLGEQKRPHQVLVGFALETNNELENAQMKLRKKNLDLIILNSLRDKGAGFKHNTNKITIIDKHNNIRKFELKAKEEVALDIIDAIEQIDYVQTA